MKLEAGKTWLSAGSVKIALVSLQDLSVCRFDMKSWNSKSKDSVCLMFRSVSSKGLIFSSRSNFFFLSYFSLTQINSISDAGMFSFIFLKQLVPQVNIWKLLILTVSNCIPKLHIYFLRLINIFCTVFVKHPSMMILLISCAQSIWQGNW